MEQLGKAWRARAAAGTLYDTPCFAFDRLVLGVGTVLAKVEDGEGPTELHGGDARLKVLLSTAYQRPIARETLDHVKAAVTCWRRGDQARAGVHLALARLARLTSPEMAARRLFMADGLMRAGVAPQAILDALDFGTPDAADMAKYNPQQPRVPAGRGRPSGRWTTTGVGGTAAQHGHPASRRPAAHAGHPSAAFVGSAPAAAAGGSGLGLDLGALSGAALTRLATFIGAFGESGALAASVAATGAVGVLGLLFIPSGGPKGQWVKVGGPGDVSYYHNPDELALLLRYTTADGVQHTVAALPGPNGDYRGPDGKIIARLVKAGLIVSTSALPGNDANRRNLCPAPVPDRPGGEKGRDYEDFGKARLNPGNPTPRGMGYSFINRITENPVIFDDCQHQTGMLVEYKGPGYAIHLLKEDIPSKGMINDILKQSQRQIDASEGKPITWFFAEKYAADYFEDAFKQPKTARPGIKVVWWPYPEDSK